MAIGSTRGYVIKKKKKKKLLFVHKSCVILGEPANWIDYTGCLLVTSGTHRLHRFHYTESGKARFSTDSEWEGGLSSDFYTEPDKYYSLMRSCRSGYLIFYLSITDLTLATTTYYQ